MMMMVVTWEILPNLEERIGQPACSCLSWCQNWSSNKQTCCSKVDHLMKLILSGWKLIWPLANWSFKLPSPQHKVLRNYHCISQISIFFVIWSQEITSCLRGTFQRWGSPSPSGWPSPWRCPRRWGGSWTSSRTQTEGSQASSWCSAVALWDTKLVQQSLSFDTHLNFLL